MQGEAKIIVLESSDTSAFECDCNRLKEAGYILRSSSCGFANSEKYDFCSSYHAIFEKVDSPQQATVQSVKANK